MKYVFLIAGLLMFTYLSAQDNSTYHLQKIIHKRYEEKKKFSTDSLYMQPESVWDECPNLHFSKRGFQIIREKVITDLFKNPLASLPKNE